MLDVLKVREDREDTRSAATTLFTFICISIGFIDRIELRTPSSEQYLLWPWFPHGRHMHAALGRFVLQRDLLQNRVSATCD